MLPNRFPDDGSAPTEDDYNNADGTVSILALARESISTRDASKNCSLLSVFVYH